MKTKDTLSSCLDLDEQEIQQLQKQAKILKENSLNKLNALKTTIQHLSSSNSLMYYTFKDAFHRLLRQNKKNCQTDFKEYTPPWNHKHSRNKHSNMDSIEEYIVERASHEQELRNRLKSRIVSDKGNNQGLENDQDLENQSNTFRDESSRSRNECNDKSTSRNDTDIRPSYDTEPMVEVPYTAEYNVFAIDTQHSEQPESINNTCVVEKVDSNVIPDSPDMCDNEIQTDQNAKDERAALANLIENLTLDTEENKKILKQLKKANASLTQELKE
ncbi:hypothetical protein Tco_0398302 [Tanacetum coccineum]